ncbi:MAG: hypothetical protein WDN72_02150 [Alphaproteobacteria bacterium]
MTPDPGTLSRPTDAAWLRERIGHARPGSRGEDFLLGLQAAYDHGDRKAIRMILDAREAEEKSPTR